MIKYLKYKFLEFIIIIKFLAEMPRDMEISSTIVFFNRTIKNPYVISWCVFLVYIFIKFCY